MQKLKTGQSEEHKCQRNAQPQTPPLLNAQVQSWKGGGFEWGWAKRSEKLEVREDQREALSPGHGKTVVLNELRAAVAAYIRPAQDQACHDFSMEEDNPGTMHNQWLLGVGVFFKNVVLGRSNLLLWMAPHPGV